MSADLRYFNLGLETDRLNADKRREPLPEPQIILRAITPKGAVRNVALDRLQLIRLIGQAAEVLGRLERMES